MLLNHKKWLDRHKWFSSFVMRIFKHDLGIQNIFFITRAKKGGNSNLYLEIKVFLQGHNETRLWPIFLYLSIYCVWYNDLQNQTYSSIKVVEYYDEVATTKSATIDILAVNIFCATLSFYRVINSNLMNVMIIRRYLKMKTCLTCNTLSADMSCLKINA